MTLVVSALAYSFHMTSFLHAKELVFCLGFLLLAPFFAVSKTAFWTALRAFFPLWLFLGILVVRLVIAPVRVPSIAIEEMTRYLLMLLALVLIYDLLFDEQWRARLLKAFHFSAVAVAVLGLAQYAGLCPALFPVFAGYTQRVYSVFGNQDFYGGYLAMAVPLLVRKTVLFPGSSPLPGASPRSGKTRLLCAAALCPLIFGLLISGSRSAWLAALAGTLVAFPYAKTTARASAVSLACLAALVLGAAWLAPEATTRRVVQGLRMEDEGVQSRVWLWRAGLEMFECAPFAGVGPGNYAYWSPTYLGDLARSHKDRDHFDPERHADHPHCDPLKLLAETGLLGFLCWTWMLARLLRHRGPEWGGLAAFLVFALFNGPLQSVPHTFGAFLFAALLLTRKSAGQAPPWPDSTKRVVFSLFSGYAMCLLSVSVSLFYMWSVILPSYRLRYAENAHVAGKQSVSLYDRALRHAWPNAEAHKNYGIALAEAGKDAEAAVEFKKALEGLDTGDIYLLLAALADRHGARDAARRWAAECQRRWPYNEQARRLLGKG